MKVLVAGIGNIFLSDDGFGCEVAQQMQRSGEPLPAGVDLADFGIRGVHLAYELLEGYDVLVLIDAAPRKLDPGTVSVIEVDQAQIESAADDVANAVSPLVDAHGMEPLSVLRILGSFGGMVDRVLVVACEPETVEEGLGLSAAVSAAVPAAIETVREVIDSVTSPKEVSR